MGADKTISLKLRVWRQDGPEAPGSFELYEATDISEHMSFLEMCDIVNETLVERGIEPFSIDSDCREGICGMCGIMINGHPHGDQAGTATCQLHMRKFKDGDEIVLEPWKAAGFPVIRDLVVDRGSFDRIIEAGGYITVPTGSAPDANMVPVPKEVADIAFDAAACIGCGACVAACPNSAAQLFTSAKLAQLNMVPQGQPERYDRVVSMVDKGDQVEVEFARTDGSEFKESFERVLVAVGRRPVSSGLGLDVAGVEVDERGFVKVDEHRRTSTPHILAIGDIAGDPMLAHKATHEGRVAAETIHGGKAIYAPKAIPAVVFTDPEIAWCGLTEDEARRQGLNVRCGTFPWEASGRAATLDRPEGITKLITEAATGRVLGMGVAGHNAGELIGEGVLAIEMGAVAEDIALSIHAHPSLSETIMEAAEQAMGQSTHFFQRM